MVGQRKRERTREEEKRDGGHSLHGRRQMVDKACMADGARWTELARRPKLARWSDSSGALSLSLSSSLSLLSRLALSLSLSLLVSVSPEII